ncbi:multidrug effflux MFS transporter [Pseudomonas sp. dw_358]|uniref:multidrug effflux MFS transporter n=1 Tax=Pseudomonas sp. dw_358 TaxID=2720083 RepID=UPI001BD29111|nr:multidrug effflux MFS transporter [Pseudomonas sp. dw_358]
MKMPLTGAVFAIYLGALAALPPLSTDMALPALTRIGADLHADSSLAGLTLSLFMAGFALSPFVYGPLSDRHGRRPLLLLGLVLFTVGGLCAALAPSMTLLLSARLLQGLGAGAGMTLAMAMVRDAFEGTRVHQRLAVITVVANVAPIIAPAMGAALLGVLGWRGIYGATALCGLVLWVMTWLALSETAQRPTPAKVAATGGVLQGYGQVFRHWPTLAHVLLNALAFGWMFAYVAGSPMVLIGQLQVSSALYTLLFACTGAGIVGGATLSGWLARRGIAMGRLMQVACVVALLATAAATALAWVGEVSVLRLMPLMVLATAAFGMIAPCAAHGALDPLPNLAGITGGLLTSLQMAAGALSSLVVSLAFGHWGVAGMTLTMLACAALALPLVLTLRRAD